MTRWDYSLNFYTKKDFPMLFATESLLKAFVLEEQTAEL